MLAASVTGKTRPKLEPMIADFPILEPRLERAEALHDRIAYEFAA
jgi:hypothetical protein